MKQRRVVSATEARVHFGELMQEALRSEEPIVVEKSGKAQIVLLAYDRYVELVAGVADADSWQSRLALGHQMVAADAGSKPLPTAVEVIRRARDARSKELGNL
mgnify:CR=1 FL=1